MSALCVHCDRDKPYHRLAAAVPDQFLACPVYVDGDFTGWHPVNRFKPREDVMSENTNPTINATEYMECKQCGYEHHIAAECKSPAAVQPPPQPAGGAGEKLVANDPSSQARWTVSKWLATHDVFVGKDQSKYAHLIDEITALLLSCPRCAELERIIATWQGVAANKEAASVAAVSETASKWLSDFGVQVESLRAKVAELERERDATWDALMETETVLPEPWFSVGAPSEFAKHIGKRLLALKAKLATVERHMQLCRSVAGVPDDETLAVHLAEMKAKCERLEKALREIVDTPSAFDGSGSAYTMKQIANAALAGKENP